MHSEKKTGQTWRASRTAGGGPLDKREAGYA